MLEPKQFLGKMRKQLGSVLRLETLVGHPQKPQVRAYSPADIPGCLAYYRCPESIQMGATLTGQGTNTRTVTVSAPSLIGRSEGLFVDIQTAGTPPAGTMRVSLNNGSSYVASGVALPTAPYAVPTSDFVLTFQQAVSYAADNTYSGVAAGFLDLIGAYPASGNNFTNSSGLNDRPFITSVGQLGSPCILFDGSNDFLECIGSIVNLYSGLSAPNFAMALTFVSAIPAASAGTLYSATSTTDADQPLQDVVFLATVSGQKLRTQRRSDAGVSTIRDSNIIYFPGPYYMRDAFDGVTRKVTANTADVIGGNSGVAGAQGGQTITPNIVSLGARRVNTGRLNFLNFELYELAFFPVEPAAQYLLGLDLYMER